MKTQIYIIFTIVLISCGQKNNDNKTVDISRKTEKINVQDKKDTEIKPQLYSILKLKNDSNIDYPNFETKQNFQDETFFYLFGDFNPKLENAEKNDCGPRLIVLNQSKKMIFKSKGTCDSWLYSPKFYKLDDNSPIFILVNTGDESGSWGNIVFMVYRQKIEDIGEINIAKYEDEEGSYLDISDFIQIYKLGEKYYFIFNSDEITYDPSGENEKTYNGNEWQYVCENGKLKFLKK